VIVEIGSGKGRFIIKSAAENPDKNFLGIEKSLKYTRVLNKHAEKSGLTNLRLLNAEAGYFVSKYIPENSVSECHIYFPDPWPKKRHNKRRLINSSFLQAVTLSLKPGGCIYYATDFKDYFDQIVEVSRACKEIEEIIYQEINPADEDPEAALTNYERKYLIQGRLIYKASYEKL
jgi:tRNA (guanine-N7-)-methyltransferase